MSELKDLDVDSNGKTVAGRAMGVGKRIGGVVLHPITYTTKGYSKSVAAIKSRARSTVQRAKNTKVIFEANLNDPDIEVMKQDFSAVMKKWGIHSEEQLLRAKKYYKAHLLGSVLGLLLILLFLVFSLDGSYYTILAIFTFMFAVTLSIVTNYWRHKVLSERHFVPFLKWIKE